MATPLDYFPQCTVSDVQNLLRELKYPPCEIRLLVTKGEYHQIWHLTLPEDAAVPKTTSDQAPRESTQQQIHGSSDLPTGTGTPSELILRVAGPHLPQIKTDNEVAVLSWLQTHTSIPVPRVLHHDRTTANALGHEYMLLAKLDGATGSDVYDSIPPDGMEHILRQLAAFQLELFAHPFAHLGGLRLLTTTTPSPDGSTTTTTTTPVPGPCCEETLWHAPDIARYWPSAAGAAAATTLNPGSASGYAGYAAWIAAFVRGYVSGLGAHASLAWVGARGGVALLERFLAVIGEPARAARLDEGVELRLAHRDLHFGQLLLEPRTWRVVGVLDWEFAQVAPLPLWRRGFLWCGDPARGDGRAERERLYGRWEEIVMGMERGREMLEAAEWRTEEQEAAWDVCNYLRCVVEVCPRGRQLEDSRRWWEEVLAALEVFDIYPEDASEGQNASGSVSTSDASV